MTNSNKSKTVTTIIAALVIASVLSTPTTLIPYANAQPKPYQIAPPMPDAIGCYHFTKVTGWQKIACASEEQLRMAGLYPPTEGGSSKLQALIQTSNPTFGETEVKFSTYNGETDSGTQTSNTWSIQLNTNQWTLSNGNSYETQFTEQNQPNSALEEACVWQIKTNSPQDYSDKHCVSVPQQTLSSTFAGNVQGYVTSSDSLEAEYCDESINQCYGVITTDDFQTKTNWFDSSGQILGVGGSSSANFVSSAQETTSIWDSPETSTQQNLQQSTNESNNLNWGPVNWSCNGGTCTETVTSSI